LDNDQVRLDKNKIAITLTTSLLVSLRPHPVGCTESMRVGHLPHHMSLPPPLVGATKIQNTTKGTAPFYDNVHGTVGSGITSNSSSIFYLDEGDVIRIHA